jgi:membrane-associated protease RseP (regulator of RpoE activity)
MFTFLFAALVSVQLGVRAVPALAPMAAAVLIANARYAAFTRQEKRDLGIGGAFAAICAGLMIWQGQRIMAQPVKVPDGPIYGFIITRARISNELVVNGILPDSPALKAGVKPGDVIERIDEIKTGKMTNEEFKPYLAASVRNGGIDLVIRRLGVKGPLKLHVSSDGR